MSSAANNSGKRHRSQAGSHLFGPGRLVIGVGDVFVMVQLFLLRLPGLLLLLLQRHQVGPLLLQLPLQPLRLPLLLYLLALVLLRRADGEGREGGQFPESELSIHKHNLEETGGGGRERHGTGWIPKGGIFR